MIIQFTLQELMLFLLFALGTATGIILLLILLKTKKMVSGLQSLLETNKESINKTIKTMPGIFENAGQISSGLRETTDKLKVSLPVIMHNVECMTSAARSDMGNEDDVTKGAPGFMAYFNAIEEVLHIISRIFPPQK